MLGIGSKSNQVYSPNNQKSHAGLALGTVTAAAIPATIYGIPKVTDAMTKSLLRQAGKDVINIMSDASKLAKPDMPLYNLIVNAHPKIEFIEKTVIPLAEQNDALQKLPKPGIKTLAKQLPFIIGAGAIVDYANNKQRAKSEPNAKTKKGNDYVKVNMGKKLGIGLGVLVETGLRLVEKSSFKNPKEVATGMLFSAVGGFILGAITDKLSNRKAAKAADKNA